MPRISIIIPVRNEEATIHSLCERIDSSLRLEHTDYEIIIVDDNSTDTTAQVIKNLSKKYPISFHTKVGAKGKGYSILEGVRHAKAPIVCMIDADLQYNPAYIPEMLKTIHDNPNIGVVVAHRKDFKADMLRRLSSRVNAFIIGHVLFGMKVDIQSGLKLFRKDIVDHIDVAYVGPWSFDIPLLHSARELGYEITQTPIVFESREKGVSDVRIVKVGSEIMLNAIRQKVARKKVYALKPHAEGSMVGAGIAHNRKRFITHSTLGHHNSAVQTLHGWQKYFVVALILIAGIGLSINVVNAVIIAFALLNGMYFLDVFFNLYMTMKTLKSSNEYSSSPDELRALDDSKLPMYTVLCPLYKEANIIPQFVDAMSKLEWPKEKLDVMLLLEEDDTATIEAAEQAQLPNFIRIVVVPHSMPKTKPKATNYGLSFAKGEYVVIYDAEDIPDPYQLKIAYHAFQRAPESIVCLQAKLNYYNPHQNTLTRLFTAEYSLWFDLILPGLQSIEAPLPLGGTSNHFRKKMLIELEGWDSFNVTEDCDLGIRLAKYGYQTAIIDSVTMEEANSNFKNWINQRSRWIKGYMQSYLVHMRFPRTFFKQNTKDFFLFQLVVGGKILALCINPIMWLMTILYFASRAHFGLFIEKLFPGPILYIGMFSLVVGNFVYLYYYMIACAKREHYSLIKYVYIVPFYWLAMSYAGYKALSELFYKPHFWQKTVHGLHLASVPLQSEDVKSSNVVNAKPISADVSQESNSARVKAFLHSYLTWGFFLGSIAGSSILNFIFNAYVGRVLSFQDLALIGMINGLVSLTAVVSGALSTTINYQTGYLIGKENESIAVHFWQRARKGIFYVSGLTACIWLVISPFLADYFQVQTVLPLLVFIPVLLINLISETDRGFLAGSFRFGSLAGVNMSEPVIKLAIVSVLLILGLSDYAYIAIPSAVTGVGILSWLAARYVSQNMVKKSADESYPFPFKFFILTLLTGLSVSFFITFDVLLAKHFLSDYEAGQYAFLTLIGKMIFFLGTFASAFTTPLVSRFEGQKKDSRRIFQYTLGITALLSFGGYLFLGLFGGYFVPLLFGTKAFEVRPYLNLISGGLALFTISKVFSDYYLIKKHFAFSLAHIILGIGELVLLYKYHGSLEEFVFVMSGIWALHLILNISLHVFIGSVSKIERGLLNIFYTCIKLYRVKSKPSESVQFKILIFNWRDTKHKWAGGAEVYVHELAKRWVQQGNKVTLFCGNSSRNKMHEWIDGVEIYRKGSFTTVYIWAFIFYVLKFRGKYDVIIDAENGLPFFTPLYAKEKVLLLIHHVHQEVFHRSLPRPLSHLAAFLEAKVMPFVYRHVEVITVSPSSSSEILKHKLTTRKPKIVHNGVDVRLYKPGKKSKRPLVMYLGRLQYYKSLNIFIRAAELVLKEYPDTKFVIAGEGEERKKLEKFAHSRGLGDKISFLGKVDEKTKISLYQKAWVFVNPSYMEGWGITTIEANACGTPVVSSKVAGLRDSVKHEVTGYLAPYGDSEQFADHIVTLIRNQKLYKKMSDESVKWAQNFTWEASAQKLFSIVQSYAK